MPNLTLRFSQNPTLSSLPYMAEGVNFVLVRTVFGAVLGMFYFGFNTGVVNAPAASIKQFTNSSYHQHYDSWLSGDKVETIFTVITSAFIGTAASHHTRMHSWRRLSMGMGSQEKYL